MHPPLLRRAAVMAALALAGCMDDKSVQAVAKVIDFGGTRPDELPVIQNQTLPFQYPAEPYARKVQGNVVLRIFIDTAGRVHPESTRVQESSGYEALDSAAVRGAQQLRFAPARKAGEPLAVSVLFPVYFRHPEAPPLPGDTLLGRQAPVSTP